MPRRGHAGRLTVDLFPEQRLVYGPRPIDARVDRDPVIARRPAPWNQAGSTLVRGSLPGSLARQALRAVIQEQ